MRQLLALLLLLCVVPLAAQSPPITNDTAVRTGTLDNGLRFWIHQNPTPADRLELRLVVRAGSILEDDDQRGLAHFVEHMAFNGTTRFRRNDLVKYLESIGVRFGADLNASTGFDETIYYLPVPTDKPDIVVRAFDILQDWAHGVAFDSTDVAEERGVVLGEWRSGLGAGSRIRDREFPVLFQGSRYAVRLPIGDTAVIAHATQAPLRRFYIDWYRPDLMAIIAVGDYPADKVETLIRERFSELRAPDGARPRPDVTVPEVNGTRVTITTDPEITSESVQLLVRRPSHGYTTESDERRSLVAGLLARIGNQRLADLQRKPDAAFTSAFFGPSQLVRNVDVFALGVSAREGQAAAAFEAALIEQRRLGVHGVLPAELERAKATLLREREQAASEQDKAFSAGFAQRYVDAFLEESATPSARTLLSLATRLLPTISVDDVNLAAREAASGTDRFIALRAPTSVANATLPDSGALIAILNRVDTLAVKAWEEAATAGPLVATPPQPGRIVRTTRHPAIGAVEWHLANGVNVLVKPTDFRADQILMGATAPGGTSLFPDSAMIDAGLATSLAAESGYGAFDAAALKRRLAGTIASVSPVLGEISQGFRGATSPKDIETFFELLWITATQPRFDSSAAAAFLNRMRPQIANRDRVPFTALIDTITITLGNNSPRDQPLNIERFNRIDPRHAHALLRERFADFSGYTFVFVGNIDTLAFRPLVARWIGALPASGRTAAWKDHSPAFLAAPVTKPVLRGKEPMSMQLAVFSGPVRDIDPVAEAAAAAAASIAETRLLETLRETMGATYSVNVMGGLEVLPRKSRSAMINFTSSPELADSLWRAADRIIGDLREKGPTAEEVATYVEKERRETEVALRTNPWWIGNIMGQVSTSQPLKVVAEWREHLDALTPERVRASARLLFDPSNTARFILLPEATK